MKREKYYMEQQQQEAQEAQKRDRQMRKTLGYGTGPIQDDEYAFDMMDQEFRYGQGPRAPTYGGPAARAPSRGYGTQPGPGYRFR